MALKPLSEVNELNYGDFVALLGNCVEQAALCAAAVWGCKPFQTVEQLQEAFGSFLDSLSQLGKEGILRLHPDLAGKLAESGELTDESKQEQASAGLDGISSEDKARMASLNAKYKEKFGFPFVICARENKVQSILKGIETRLENTKAEEAVTGVNEVKKICSLRIKDLVV